MSDKPCIVVGVDGSEGSRHALIVAAELGAGLGAEVVAVHAFEPLALLGEVPPPIDFVALRAEVAEEMERDWVGPLRDAGVTYRCLIVEDRPVKALLRAAEDVGATHIVVGTRGVGGFKGLLVGSVASTLPGHAHLPVTIVPPAA